MLLVVMTLTEAMMFGRTNALLALAFLVARRV
jgi:hypothetical protein